MMAMLEILRSFTQSQVGRVMWRRRISRKLRQRVEREIFIFSGLSNWLLMDQN